MAVTADVAGLTGVWTDVYILRRFVEMLEADLLLAKFSEPAQIPANTGGYVARWNIPASFAGSTTVITEASAGTVGEKTTTGITAVESTINTYGEFMKIGEIAAKSFVPQTMDVFAEQFAFAGASAIDTLIRTQALTSTNFMHSGDTSVSGVTLDSGDNATITDFRTIAGFFYGTNARGFKMLQGDFAWIMHPAQEVFLTTEFTTTGMTWTDVNQNSDPGFRQLVDNHRIIGRHGSVTALRTTQIGTVAEDVTAHAGIALARFGLGWAGLGESGPSKPQIIRKRPDSNDTSQPLNLYETIAWKVKLAAAMLDANRVLVVYSAAQ